MNGDILKRIDSYEATAVELEALLCSHPAISPESGGEGELDKCRALEAWLRARGVSELERHDAPDARAKGGVRPNLIATLPGASDEKRLWIMSHLDVVPPGEASLWKTDPWTVVAEGGRVYGRGVEDNQQGLCSSVLASLALLSAGVRPPHTVKLLFVADEEMGSEYGIQWLLANRALFRPDDMVLIPDSGDPSGEPIEVAEKNLLWLKLTVKGAQCHGSRPDQGANAHLAAAELAVRLHDELARSFPGRDELFDPPLSTFEPTKTEANVPNVNTIPGEDIFYMDMRVLPRYPLVDVLAAVEAIEREVEAKRKVRIVHEALQRVESKPTSPDAPIVRLLSEAARAVYGGNPRPVGIGGGTVGAYLRNAGIDSVVWARIHESAHQPNEFADIANILGDAKVMARLMLAER